VHLIVYEYLSSSNNQAIVALEKIVKSLKRLNLCDKRF
jgi:hypothetical protein